MIEERARDEVSQLTGIGADGEVASVRIVDQNTAVANPAFDITPARLITGIVTERGSWRPPISQTFPEHRRAA